MEPSYTFWKRPWVKWLALAAAVLNAVSLYQRIADYRLVSASGIMSPEAWRSYALQQQFQGTVDAVLLVLFLLLLLVGGIVKTRRQALIGESVLVFSVTLMLGLSLLLFRPGTKGPGLLWLLYFALSVILSGVQLFRLFRKSA